MFAQIFLLQIFDKGPAYTQMSGHVLNIHALEQLQRIRGERFGMLTAFRRKLWLQP